MMAFSKPLVAAATAIFFALSAPTTDAQGVGDVVCAEGFIMDYFCIELGTLLDDPSTETLLGPDKHSVHCLVDIRQCYDSPFEILIDPAEGEEIYARGWRVDDAGRQMLIDLARVTGMRAGASRRCSTCTEDEGDIEFGFRAAVKATVASLASDGTPALLDVIEVNLSEIGCVDEDGNQMEVTMPDELITSGAGSINQQYYTHGSLMLISWGVLLPLGAIFGKFLKHRGPIWFKIHVGLQTLGLVMAIVGFSAAVRNFDAFADKANTSKYNYEHAIMGTVVMALGMAQPLNGTFVLDSLADR